MKADLGQRDHMTSVLLRLTYLSIMVSSWELRNDAIVFQKLICTVIYRIISKAYPVMIFMLIMTLSF